MDFNASINGGTSDIMDTSDVSFKLAERKTFRAGFKPTYLLAIPTSYSLYRLVTVLKFRVDF